MNGAIPNRKNRNMQAGDNFLFPAFAHHCCDGRSMTMDTKIRFQKKATVLAADGIQVGSIERVVVNPKTNVLTDIVVRKGGLLEQEEKVVPIGLVAETGGSQIVLRDTAGTLEGFPAFEERRLIDGDNPQAAAKAPSTIIGYPALGIPMTITPGKPAMRIEQNIPEGTVALKEGARVISAEGKHVGNVESVLADSDVDQVTDLIVSTGMFAREKRLIPMKWVMVVGEDEVRLRVNKESVEEFADTPIAA
jgi:uncharacterized protein YrrD